MLRHQNDQLDRTHRYQAEQETLKDARALRDKLREERRTCFIALLDATSAMLEVARESSMVLEGETTEERDNRLGKRLREALASTHAAELSLELDDEMAELVELYGHILRTFLNWQRLSKVSEHAAIYPSVRLPEVREQLKVERDKLERLVGEFHGKERDHLRRLWRPVGGSDTSGQTGA